MNRITQSFFSFPHEGRAGKWGENRFITSAVALLGATALAKIWSAFGAAKLLDIPDPLVGLQFGQLMLIAGVLELLVVGVCLFVKSRTLSLISIAWLSTMFLFYRLGLYWMGWKKPCSCFGNLTDSLGVPPHFADNASKVILCYLLLGSYGLLTRQWYQARNQGQTVKCEV